MSTVKQRCILLEAAKEVQEEKFRKAVEEEKERLKKKVPLLHRLIPFTIEIKRRHHKNDINR